MASDARYLGQPVVSSRLLVDLFEPLLEILRTHGEEHHVQANPQREMVYWQTRPIMLDEDGELRIVSIRTVPVPADGELDNPLRRVEFFEKRELQIDVEGTQGLLTRLIVGSWGDGVALYVFDNGTGRNTPFTRQDFDYYLKLTSTAADTLNPL